MKYSFSLVSMLLISFLYILLPLLTYLKTLMFLVWTSHFHGVAFTWARIIINNYAVLEQDTPSCWHHTGRNTADKRRTWKTPKLEEQLPNFLHIKVHILVLDRKTSDFHTDHFSLICRHKLINGPSPGQSQVQGVVCNLQSRAQSWTETLPCARKVTYE